MHFRHFLAASAASLTLACALAAPAWAQETTAAIDGEITQESGSPLPGAKVTVTHVPSGSVSTAVSDGGGHYALRGLRVGGPYTVTVEAGGYAASTVNDIQISVGETLAVPVQMDTREIVVSAQAGRSVRSLVTGSQSAFNAEDIANTVSSRRDIRDLMRKDLMSTFNANVGGVSIAGGNIRTQRFSVDGVQLQDSFGLNYGGLPSTRGIVSLEAIDQLTVKAAPYDISEGNFQGGAVNVVLKSGTNDIHGSIFGNWGGDKLTGNFTRDNFNPIGVKAPVSRTKILGFSNYGGSLSGPIIKDTLFIAASYEELSEGSPNTFGVRGSSAANPVPNANYTDSATFRGLTSIINAFTSNYGSFPIGDVPTAIAETDKKYSIKADWNIAPGHRFSASFIHHENILPQYGSAGSNSGATPYIALQSDIYRLTEFTNAASAQLNSQWSDNFSTELRASYKYYKRGQDAYNGADFAQFNVCADNASSGPLGASILTAETVCNTGIPIVRMGPDTPRQANAFNNKILTFQANATYRAGDHTIKLEYDNAHSKLYNLFVFGTIGLAGTGGPQGLYYFDSYNDFVAKQANELVLNSTTTGNKADGFVRWGYTVHTVGLQDTWRPTANFTVNAGLRFDFYDVNDRITVNSNFQNRFRTLYPGLNNASTLNGREKLQPRLGFNWSPTPTLRVAGGVGLFSGGLSDVFISNNYSNTGSVLNSTGAAITGIDLVRLAGGQCIDRSTNTNPGPAVCAALNNVNGATPNAAALAYLQTNTGVLANATTNSLDPKFKLPAQWKYNLSLNWKPELAESGIASGWTLRADVLYSKAQQAIRWTDLRAQPLVIGGVTQLAPDGRPRYGGLIGNAAGGLSAPGGNSDIQLTNTTKGKSLVFAVGVEKSFGDWLDINAAYTHQNVKDVAGVLVSSTVGSSYGVLTADPNSGGAYGRSVFEVTNSWRAEAQFHHKFFGDAETRFGISWNYRSGVPYGLSMADATTSGGTGRGSVFGTVNTGNTTSAHMLYVPDFSQTATSVNYATIGTTATTANNVTTYGTAATNVPTAGIRVGNVIFADQATLDAMKALVNGTKLSKYQGQIAPKNVLTGPSYKNLNLNFAQEIPLFWRVKVTALFSIENFLNLLDRNWGSYQEFSNTAVIRVQCANLQGATTGAQACPLYQYSSYNNPLTQTYSKASLWTIRAGARLSF